MNWLFQPKWRYHLAGEDKSNTNQQWLGVQNQRSGKKAANFFRLTEIDNEGFTAENPDKEFPKKIMYRIVGDKLKAVISGGDMEIYFEFKRIGN